MAARLLKLDPDATLAIGVVNSRLDFDYASAMANLDHARKPGYLTSRMPSIRKRSCASI
jgi:hypothetical protein